MVTQQLIDFIKEQLGQGKKEEDLKQALLLQGWKEEDINQGILSVKNPGMDIPSPPPVVSEKSTTRLANIGVSLSEAWKICKKNFWKFWLIMIVFGAIAYGCNVGLAWILMKFLPNSSMVVNIIAAIIAIIIEIAIITFVSAGSVAVTLLSGNNDEPKPLSQVLKIGFKKSLSFLWLSIITSLISCCAFIPFVLAFFLGGSGIILIVTLVISIILGLVVFIWSIFADYVLIFEKEKGLNAFLKSRAYASKHALSIFWRYLFVGICFFAILIVITLIITAIIGHDNMNKFEDLFSSVLSMLITPFLMGYGYSIYKNVKGIEEQHLLPPTKKERVLFSIFSILGLATLGFIIYEMSLFLLMTIQFIKM